MSRLDRAVVVDYGLWSPLRWLDHMIRIKADVGFLARLGSNSVGGLGSPSLEIQGSLRLHAAFLKLHDSSKYGFGSPSSTIPDRHQKKVLVLNYHDYSKHGLGSPFICTSNWP